MKCLQLFNKELYVICTDCIVSEFHFIVSLLTSNYYSFEERQANSYLMHSEAIALIF